MEIQVDPHTKRQMEKRGVTEEEVKDVIESGDELKVKKGRLGKYKVYAYNKEWFGKRYEQKRVEVVYVKEKGKIVTVTVYSYYGRW